MTKTFFKNTVIAITLLLLFAAGAGAALVQIRGGELLSVQSGSMEPGISKGHVVVVKRVPAKDLRVGDIITFINPADTTQTITHRIITVPEGGGDTGYITKGDANQLADPPITAQDIVGQVTYGVPYVGYVLDLLRQPAGLVLIIYIPALLIIYEELRHLTKYYKSIQPYVSPGWDPRHHKRPKKLAHAIMLFVGSAFIMFIAIAPAAHAALTSMAVLSKNSIGVAPPASQTGIVLSSVELQCWQGNTPTTNMRAYVDLHNASKETIDLSGWHIQDNSGVATSFESGMTLRPGQSYSVRLFLSPSFIDGLQYAGDRIALHGADGKVVDGISWGGDDSQLTFPIEGVSPGSHLKRKQLRFDAGTTAEWQHDMRDC